MAKKDYEEKNFLDFVPRIPKELNYSINEDGQVTIYQENKGLFNWIAQKLLKKPRVSQIHLEEMGNYIWPLIDGKNTVFDIAQMVKEHFGEKAEPLYDRLCKYLKTLKDYGFIEF